MTLTNYKGEQVTLTEKEEIVVNYILQMHADGNLAVYGEDVEYGTTLNNRIARGTLSSLVKKELIYVDRENGGLISKMWK